MAIGPFSDNKNGEIKTATPKEKKRRHHTPPKKIKQLNKMKECTMSEKEVTIMVIQFINRIDEKINNLCENQEEIQSDMATVKHTMEGFKRSGRPN